MDKETFDTISKIAEEHCKKTFGYLDEEDLKSEIWLICLDKIKEYNSSRGELEHFLRVSVKNRLVNRFKDITKSVRSPCPRCPFLKEGFCTKFGDDNRYSCDKWRNYRLSVESRNSLLNASEPSYERSADNRTLDAITGAELRDIIKNLIPPECKRDFDQFISGGKLSKQRIKKLKRIINIILLERSNNA